LRSCQRIAKEPLARLRICPRPTAYGSLSCAGLLLKSFSRMQAIDPGFRSDGVLTIRDHGPGFDEGDLPFVFDRFHRAKAARSKPGSGLGLAIVRQAAESHGGFAAAANAPGGGAMMRISFGPPLALDPEIPEPVSAS